MSNISVKVTLPDGTTATAALAADAVAEALTGVPSYLWGVDEAAEAVIEEAKTDGDAHAAFIADGGDEEVDLGDDEPAFKVDLGDDEPAFKVGDRVEYDGSDKCVTPRYLAGDLGTVEVTGRVTAVVRFDRTGNMQIVRTEHLAPEALHDFRVGDLVRVSDDPKVDGDKWVDPDLAGAEARVEATSGEHTYGPQAIEVRGVDSERISQWVDPEHLTLVMAAWERELLGDADEPAPLQLGDRVAVISEPGVTERAGGVFGVHVGDLGTVISAPDGGSLLPQVKTDEGVSQLIHPSHLARVIDRAPEEGDRVIRTGDHMLSGWRVFGDSESSRGDIATVLAVPFAFSSDTVRVRWAERGTTSAIHPGGLTVIEG